jgi:hypothetical protein
VHGIFNESGHAKEVLKRQVKRNRGSTSFRLDYLRINSGSLPSISVQPQGHECLAVESVQVNQLWQPMCRLGRVLAVLPSLASLSSKLGVKLQHSCCEEQIQYF